MNGSFLLSQETALEHVKHYIKKRNEMNDKLETFEKQLSEEKEKHSSEVSLLDRRKAVEIDQLKKEMMARIR